MSASYLEICEDGSAGFSGDTRSSEPLRSRAAGARVPNGGNLKLLRVGEAHPEAVFGSLYTAPAEPARSTKPRATRKSRAQAA